MIFQGSAMDAMNNAATDVVECEICETENVSVLNQYQDDESGALVTVLECNDCSLIFSTYK